MEKYDPVNMERAAKNALGIAVAKEFAQEYIEGRRPIVFLDARHLDNRAHDAIRRGLPIYVGMLEKSGLDLTKDLIRYKMTVQACIGAGGIRINKERASTVPGLYVAGSSGDHAEDGATNVIGHGMESAVSGRIAGQSAARYALQAGKPVISKRQAGALAKTISRPVFRTEGTRPQMINEEIGKLWEAISVVRNKRVLSRAMDQIKELKEDKVTRLTAIDYHEVASVIGITNKVAFLELFIQFASKRTESRGGHFREDYPERDDKNWLKWVICQREGEGSRVWVEPVPFEKYREKPLGSGG
jgi:succinate dehydrogenase/fumarate reductase flavoprotein subunit